MSICGAIFRAIYLIKNRQIENATPIIQKNYCITDFAVHFYEFMKKKQKKRKDRNKAKEREICIERDIYDDRVSHCGKHLLGWALFLFFS